MLWTNEQIVNHKKVADVLEGIVREILFSNLEVRLPNIALCIYTRISYTCDKGVSINSKVYAILSDHKKECF